MVGCLLQTAIILADDASNPSLYAPTPVEIISEILSSVKVQSTDILYDLGCGDGRVPIITNLLYSAKCVGIELDENTALDAIENVKLNNLEGKVIIYQGDITESDFSQASLIYLYLQPELSEKIRDRLLTLRAGSSIIAYDKRIPKWEPTKIRKLSNGKKVYIYVIPEKYKEW